MYIWLWMVVDRAVWYPGRVVPLGYCRCWRWRGSFSSGGVPALCTSYPTC